MINYSSLTLHELISLAETDTGAREYFADNARRFIEEIEAIQEGYDPAGCYDDGYDAGRRACSDELESEFAESLATEIEKPGIDADLLELLIGLRDFS